MIDPARCIHTAGGPARREFINAYIGYEQAQFRLYGSLGNPPAFPK
jgi:hypothetical protein